MTCNVVSQRLSSPAGVYLCKADLISLNPSDLSRAKTGLDLGFSLFPAYSNITFYNITI